MAKKEYTTNYLLSLFVELNQIDIKKQNPMTTYLIGRNLRILKPIVDQFEKDRTEIMEDEWFKEYQETKDDEKYKDQLDEANKEIDKLLAVKKEIEFYKLPITALSFDSVMVMKFMDDLIKDEK